MYYKLKEPWAFRGWKGLPYAICAEYGSRRHEKPVFFGKETFMALLCCNGEEDTDIRSLSNKDQTLIEQFVREGILSESETPLPSLLPWQRYLVYPARYEKGVHWSITGKCNFRCRHCLVSAPDGHHPQLPLKDCLHIVDEIARCGIHSVDITGGEPLVRSDFGEIVKALSEYRIDIGVLFTNASLLTKDTLEMLRKYRQCPTFQLSFDGLGYHDWLRGVPGAEAQADAAFRLLKEYGFPVIAGMCIHKKNRDCLRETVKYLSSYNVMALRVNTPQELGVWKQYSSEYALSFDEAWDIYKEYISCYFEDGMPIDIELDGFFKCKKGQTDYKVPYVHHADADADWDKVPYCESVRYNIYIGPDGRLAPCMGFSDTVLGKKFPSVMDHHLGDLTLQGYYHDVVETKISDLLKKNPDCASCGFLPVCCGGCMVESMKEDGDYLVPDKRCCYFHKHIGEDAVRRAADAAIARFCKKNTNT